MEQTLLGVSLLDASGKKLWSGEGKRIPIGALRTGLYFVKMRTSEGEFTKGLHQDLRPGPIGSILTPAGIVQAGVFVSGGLLEIGG